ncbi:HAD hydrolase family protein [Candidatus Woesearchaeota archaeon]|nr:HAD hydrolase family protein [Candidatus Woesearchaeota archaeon]
MFKLIVFDCDGVLFEDVKIWMQIHNIYGTLKEGEILTKRYLDVDYETLVKKVVSTLWKGKDASKYYELIDNVNYMIGISDLMSYVDKNFKTKAIISAGSLDLVKRAQRDFGFNYIFANELVIKENIITGDFVATIKNGDQYKSEVLHSLCKELNITLNEVIYIGDTHRDSHIFQEVGLPIAFNCNDEHLLKYAKEVVNSADLRDLIPVLEKYLVVRGLC